MSGFESGLSDTASGQPGKGVRDSRGSDRGRWTSRSYSFRLLLKKDIRQQQPLQYHLFTLLTLKNFSTLYSIQRIMEKVDHCSACTHTHKHAFSLSHTHTRSLSPTHTQPLTSPPTHSLTYTDTPSHTHSHAHIRTLTHTHPHTHTHTH